MFPQKYLHRCYKWIAHFDKFPFSFLPVSFASCGFLSSIIIFRNFFVFDFTQCFVSAFALFTFTNYTLTHFTTRSQFVVINVFCFPVFRFNFSEIVRNFKSFRRQFGGRRQNIELCRAWEMIPIRFHYSIVLNGRWVNEWRLIFNHVWILLLFMSILI